MNEDLPYDVKTRRADIRAVATQARSTGAKVKLQGDRVVIDSKVYKLSTHYSMFPLNLALRQHVQSGQPRTLLPSTVSTLFLVTSIQQSLP